MAAVVNLANEVIAVGRDIINQNFQNINAELTAATLNVSTLQNFLNSIPIPVEVNGISPATSMKIMQATSKCFLEEHVYFTSGINLGLLQRIDHRLVNSGSVILSATYTYKTGALGQVINTVTWNENPATTNIVLRTDTYLYNASDNITSITRV